MIIFEKVDNFTADIMKPFGDCRPLRPPFASAKGPVHEATGGHRFHNVCRKIISLIVNV